jgi:preprotein translocase subunit SecA
VIVEKALTGEFKRGSRWGNGLHECLEVKEGLTVQPSSRTLAAVSHSLFFRHYSRMIGLSGSLGSPSEQAELEKVYGLSTFHVPPHRPSLFIKHPPLIAPDPLTHESWLLERLLEAAHRPVILLVLTIAESFRLQAVIQKDKRFSEPDRTIQVYNEKQKESKKYILDRAGYPGVVTIATHIGGRGTDYRLKGKSQAFGFLLLYLFFPENRRVELQGFGRVARQGEPGEGQYLLHPESPGVPPFFKTLSFGSAFFDQLFAWRERKNEALILHRAELLKKSEHDFERLSGGALFK